MWRFETEQKVCNVGGVEFGGRPGRNPMKRPAAIWPVRRHEGW